MPQVSSRVALVTGANKSIGFEIARAPHLQAVQTHARSLRRRHTSLPGNQRLWASAA
jgi:NAD(P)-dependent dehydrogenase (short-subunit alcohol dehydrogenase family)